MCLPVLPDRVSHLARCQRFCATERLASCSFVPFTLIVPKKQERQWKGLSQFDLGLSQVVLVFISSSNLGNFVREVKKRIAVEGA